MVGFNFEVFQKICETCHGMRLDSGHFVFGAAENERQNLFPVNLLKVWFHVITDLTDGLESTIPDFGVRIGK